MLQPNETWETRGEKKEGLRQIGQETEAKCRQQRVEKGKLKSARVRREGG